MVILFCFVFKCATSPSAPSEVSDSCASTDQAGLPVETLENINIMIKQCSLSLKKYYLT